MTEYSSWISRRRREGLFSAISAGFFLILVGAIFVFTPNLFTATVDFLTNFEFVQIPNTVIWWLAPTFTAPLRFSYPIVYTAVQRFAFIWGLYQIFVLAVRFVVGSRFSKKTETAGNLVFWLGTSYLIGVFLTGTFLLDTTHVTLVLGVIPRLTIWFAFWGALVILLGVSMIIRGLIAAGALAFRPRKMA